jgi:8-oxo-dGTP pyrophosphatase MutT (NUDIX family)
MVNRKERAQCLVIRENKILMVKHRQGGEEWWCLPGGAIEKGETPEEAAIRELKEECLIDGKVIRQTGYTAYSANDKSFTFEMDIGTQNPILGIDPDLPLGKQVLIDVQWLELSEIPERDRVYLWAAGLLGIGEFLSEVSGWGNDISYPGKGINDE